MKTKFYILLFVTGIAFSSCSQLEEVSIDNSDIHNVDELPTNEIEIINSIDIL